MDCSVLCPTPFVVEVGTTKLNGHLANVFFNSVIAPFGINISLLANIK